MKPIPDAAAELRLLHHSGVTVSAGGRLLVFDWWKDGSLPGGIPALAAGRPVTVFASHRHPDHWNPAVLAWRDTLPDVTYVLSSDIPPQPGCHAIAPGETLELPGLTVSALRSTDEGVAFVVRCGGGAFYHAGDLNWWHWDGEPDAWNAAMARDYRAELEKLAGTRLDAAFVPVDGRLGEAFHRGIGLFAELVDCPHLVPIHWSSDPSVLRRLAETPGPWKGRLCILDAARPAATIPLGGEGA